jgi:hypothetical protein
LKFTVKNNPKKMTKSIYSLICALILISICSEVSRGDDPEGLSVGEKAPLFHGIDQFNNEFNLEQQLREGPVVLIFYRGHWCKYCNQHLESLNRIHYRKRCKRYYGDPGKNGIHR